MTDMSIASLLDGRHLWAYAQTAMRDDWRSLKDANGYLPPEHWPRVYGAPNGASSSG